MVKPTKKCYSGAAVPSIGHENSQLSTIKLKAKITYLTVIMKSPDPLVNQLHELLVSNYIQQNF